jgi:hypothetical protein
MEIDYGDVIKTIFDQKKPAKKKYIKKKKYSLKSIPSLPSEENYGNTAKSSLKSNIKKEKENQNKNEESNELNIINLDDSKNNKEFELRNDILETENNLDNKIENEEEEFISKLKNEIKDTKDHKMKINTTDNNLDSNSIKYKNNQLKKNQNLSEKNIKENQNNFFENKINNKSSSNLNQNQKQKRINSRQQNSKLLKEELEQNKMNNQKLNKYEQYNTEALAYEAIKNYSHCKPKEKNFLQRMEFYSVKKQTEGKIIDLMVNKAVRKIPEKEKIIIFNRLIEDSNRRAEARNRIEILNQNKKIANEIYDDKIFKKKKKKFDQREFDDIYQQKIIKKLKEKERKIELLRKQKIQEEKDKEDLIVNEMRSRNKKVSQIEIDSISKRLYNEANNRKLKREMLRSFSELERRLNTISDFNKTKRNYSSFFLQPQNHYLDKISNLSKSKNNYTNYINLSNYSNNEISPSLRNISYKNKMIHQMNKSNNNNSTSHSLYRNMKYFSYNNKKYVPYYNAERMIDEFFLK